MDSNCSTPTPLHRNRYNRQPRRHPGVPESKTLANRSKPATKRPIVPLIGTSAIVFVVTRMPPNASAPHVVNQKRRRAGGRRKLAGIAVVEFAVCLPILVLVVFSSIEACNAIYLKQAATASAYEAARVATGTGGTLAAGQLRGQEILTARSVSGAQMTFTPAAELNWQRGTPINVQVSIPANSNNLGGINMFFQGHNLQCTIVMVKQ